MVAYVQCIQAWIESRPVSGWKRAEGRSAEAEEPTEGTTRPWRRRGSSSDGRLIGNKGERGRKLMEEKHDVRLEMVTLAMEEDSRAADAPAPLAADLMDFESPRGLDELDRAELGMSDGAQNTEAVTIQIDPAGWPLATPDHKPQSTQKSNNEGSIAGREFRDATTPRETIPSSRDMARMQKTQSSPNALRESLLSEARASFLPNTDMRGACLIADDEFDREFGSSASGGSGQSTPKRRNGSRGRASRMEAGGEGGSFKDTVLKGNLLDALKANAVDLSPRCRLSKDHGGSPFLGGGEPEEEEPVAASPAASPITVTIAKTLFYVLVWYTFSTCLTLYNKLLLGEKLGNFPAPLLMNTIHFSMQAIISTLLVRFWCGNKTQFRMSWKDYFLRVVPTAGATALDIDLSNISIVFISVSFATMCKSGAPVFLLLFAFAFKLEVPSFKLLGIIIVISIGVMLTVAKETEFELRGFILVMLATVMSGFRWTVTQLLLQKEEYGLSNPIAAMSYLTPVMALITAAFSLAMEPWHKLGGTQYFDTPRHIFESCALMLLGGALAFFMVMAEYFLIAETSAVTLTIAGVIKEVVTIVVAVFFFHDQFTLLKGVGLIVIIFGVSLFNWFKYQKLVEGRLGNGASQQEGIRSPLKYAILKDETAKLGDESEHVL